jgi:uncharacterized membrane protein
MPRHPTSLRSILILSSHLRLGLPSGRLPSGLPTKILYAPLFSRIRATFPVHLILLDLITRIIFGDEYRSLSSSLCSLLHSPIASSREILCMYFKLWFHMIVILYLWIGSRYFYSLILHPLLYLFFVFCLSEDGHMVGRNVGCHCVQKLLSVCLCTFVGTTTLRILVGVLIIYRHTKFSQFNYSDSCRSFTCFDNHGDTHSRLQNTNDLKRTLPCNCQQTTVAKQRKSVLSSNQ